MTVRKIKTLDAERARLERKVATESVAQARALIKSWIAEAELKLEKAEMQGAATAGAYLKGRLDGYRDCLAVLNQ